MSPPIVGFAGMTHLGLVSASAVAGRGFEVVCFDADSALVDRLTRRDWPVLESGLDELIRGNGARQRFTSVSGNLTACDLVYVAPDVPTDDQGTSDISSLTALIRDVAAVIHADAVMVVLSQVPPGYTRTLDVWPRERLYYQVETLVFGQAVERALKPERTIVGCADPAAALDPRFRAVLDSFGCPILPMCYESAELAKISINCCLVASITVANTLAELCERIGADWSEIAPALKLDRRIGPHAYLTPGLGIAGGNLERDLATVARLSQAHGTDSSVVQAWLHNSRHRRNWAVRTIRDAVLDRAPDAILAIWGLAYKANTHSVKNSPSLATLSQLGGARLRVHDPVVPTDIIARLDVEGCVDPITAVTGADALMILTPWPEYGAVTPAKIAGALRGRTVVDPYGVLDGQEAGSAGLSYYTLGQPPIGVT